MLNLMALEAGFEFKPVSSMCVYEFGVHVEVGLTLWELKGSCVVHFWRPILAFMLGCTGQHAANPMNCRDNFFTCVLAKNTADGPANGHPPQA